MSPDEPAARGHHVQIRGATKRYGPTTALAGVDLEVQPGEFLVLLGPSGSGKSTLVRSLAGVERLDAGTLHLGGRLTADGKHHLPPEHRDLAMVFQDYALWPHLTVAGNVGYALRRRRLGRDDARERTERALRRVGLARHAGRYPNELSGGEQQRVALARAVVAEPKLLLFDEPLSNLDADLRERLRVQIATLTRETGATAVYITHDQAEAFALADRIGVLDRGTLLQTAAPEEIYRHPAAPFVAHFTGVSGELPGRVAEVVGAIASVVVAGDAVVHGHCIGTVGRGAAVRVLVRPAATRIAAACPAGAVAGTTVGLAGVVTDVAFRGRGYDHVVACPSGTLAAVHDQVAHPRGTSVQVQLDPAGCLVHEVATTGDGDMEEITTVSLADQAASIGVAGSSTAGGSL